MKNSIINSNIFKKLSKINLVKKAIPGLTVLALSVTLSGCDNNENENNFSKKDKSTSSIIVEDNSSSVIEDNFDTTYVEADESISDYAFSGIYTENDWNNFVNESYKKLEGTNINVTKEKFEVALLLLNQEYIQNTNEEETNKILENYFINSEGIDIYDDMNKLLELLSLIRENNTSDNAEFYSLSNLLIPEFITPEDESIINSLENDALIVRNYYIGVDVNEDTVKEIFESTKKFGLGKSEINGYTQADLSLGAIFITENMMQEISVMSQNVVSEESRKELDEKLNSVNGLNNLEREWYSLSEGVRKYVKPIEKDTKYDELYNTIINYREEVYSEVKNIKDISKDGFDSLYAIANIDYFLKDTRTQYVFESLYGTDFDITDTYYKAEETLDRIMVYNMAQPNNETVDLSRLFIDNDIDKLSVSGINYLINDFKTTDYELILDNAEFILDYSKYDNNVTINVTNESTNEVTKYPKASLSKGGTQIVNWMTYFAMVKYSNIINNDVIVESTKGLVDGHDELSNIYAEIVVMLDEKCSYRNEYEYSYKINR